MREYRLLDWVAMSRRKNDKKRILEEKLQAKARQWPLTEQFEEGTAMSLKQKIREID